MSTVVPKSEPREASRLARPGRRRTVAADSCPQGTGSPPSTAPTPTPAWRGHLCFPGAPPLCLLPPLPPGTQSRSWGSDLTPPQPVGAARLEAPRPGSASNRGGRTRGGRLAPSLPTLGPAHPVPCPPSAPPTLSPAHPRPRPPWALFGLGFAQGSDSEGSSRSRRGWPGHRQWQEDVSRGRGRARQQVGAGVSRGERQRSGLPGGPGVGVRG